MNKSDIESIFRNLLSQDDCTDLMDDGIYKIRPLYKTSKGDMIEYGFSVSLFGVLALRTNYKGKWAEHIETTFHCAQSLDYSHENVSTGDFVRIHIGSPEQLIELCGKIYNYCKNNIHGEFDCCSQYKECSDALCCVSPLKQRALLCRYRKKLEKGIVFFGKNRNADNT